MYATRARDTTDVQGSCLVCWTEYDPDQLTVNVCGHTLCKTCWKGYVAASVENGPSCLVLRCPAPDCSSYVGINNNLCPY